MVFGIIIRYGFGRTYKKSIIMRAANFSSIKDLPEYIHLVLPNKTSSAFAYVYKNPIILSELHSRDYEERVKFDPEIFFNILLPPIIFHAGYSMKRVYSYVFFD